MTPAPANKLYKRNGGGGVLLLLLLLVVMETPLEIGGAPFLLGNQMTSLSVIPRTEEQAAALLEFLRNNPQYGGGGAAANSTTTTNTTRQIEVNAEKVILVPLEDLGRLSNGLEEIGLGLDDSKNTYQIS